MVLKTRPKAKSFLPSVPGLTSFFISFKRFLTSFEWILIDFGHFYCIRLVPDSRLNQSDMPIQSFFKTMFKFS